MHKKKQEHHPKRKIIYYPEIILRAFLLVLVLLFFPISASGNDLTDMNISLAVDRQLTYDENIPAHLISTSTTDGVVSLTGTVDNLLAKERSEKIASTVRGVRSVINRILVLPFPTRSDDEIRQDIKDALLYDPATEAYEVDVQVKNGVVILSGTVDSYQEGIMSGKVAKGVDGVVELINNITYAPKEDRSDLEIKTEAEQRLYWNVWINEDAFDIEVENGVVKVSGTARSLDEKNRVKYVAWVKGAKSVDVTGVKVDWLKESTMIRSKRPMLQSDNEIKKAVEDTFSYDPRLLPGNIEVMVNNGTVSLTGSVTNLLAKNAAEDDARNTVGVLRVNNWVKVQPLAYVLGGKELGSVNIAFTDEDILEKVNQALEKSRYVTEDQVHASVFLGRVYLTGTVESFFEKDKAEEIEKKKKGVIDVKNNIVVYLGLPESEDWEILQDIQDELFWSPFVDENQVSVSVKDGTAYLSGEVDTVLERTKAVENAYEGGAKTVINYLTVKNHPYYQ